MFRVLRFAVLMGLVACSAPEHPQLQDELLTVACGYCIFKTGDARGCYWAAEIDDAHLPILNADGSGGEIVPGHASHGPDGMCTMPREARVDGEIRNEALFVSRFDLLPAENVPDVAPVHTHEH